MNFPIGTIIMWGNSASPLGWQVCDGTNGTPNMIDYFPFGASDDDDIGRTAGGALTHTHTMSNTDTRADHNHGGSKSTTSGGPSSTVTTTSGTGSTAAGSGHTHSLNISISPAGSHYHTIGTTGSASNLPPHIKRVFIQRIS